MGGTALGFQADRLDLEAYHSVSQHIVDILNDYFEHISLPRQAPGKQSFGDVDILVSGPKQELDTAAVFGSTACFRNGTQLSFDHHYHDGRRFQIDLLEFEPDQLTFASFCYGDGDLSILLGMSLCRIKLKWGYQGLTLINNSQKLVLTRTDLKLALSFLGMSYDDWKQGFDDDTALFEYVTSNRFFRPFPQKTQFNRDERRVMETRPMVVRFFAWMRENEHRFCTDPIDCAVVRDEAIEYFNKQPDLDAIQAAKECERALRDRFNGHIVMAVTELKGSKLADFMKHCRGQMTDGELMDMSAEAVRDNIDRMWHQYVT
jgi:hypothetical protein